MIGIFSTKLAEKPFLQEFLGKATRRQRSYSKPDGLSAIAGIGAFSTDDMAGPYTVKYHLPYLTLADGFLCSIGLPGKNDPACSLLVDDMSSYQDAHYPSRLEWIIHRNEISEPVLQAGQRALGLIRKHRLSKYNDLPSDIDLQLPAGQKVLVIDQAADDLSIEMGYAHAQSFRTMLDAALSDNPDALILVKMDWSERTANLPGYLSVMDHHPRVRYLTEACNFLQVIEQVDRVYTVTSDMGFEALMLEKPVACFGLPWYACWGLTHERSERRDVLEHRRYHARTLDQLFTAAYIQYARYVDPDTGRLGSIFDAIRHLADGKRRNDESRGTTYCIGMSTWKKAAITPFLSTPSAKLVFLATASKIPKHPEPGRILIWGRKDEDNPLAYETHAALPVARMGDGFLRSVGLGSNLKPPLSLVFDTAGIYYDPRTPSALEQWLKTADLSSEERARANYLAGRLLKFKLSKYNVGGTYAPSAAAGERRVLLIVGQVEGDASLRYGSPEIKSNADLISRVRAGNQDAYIIYKPHPDVVAGNREGGIGRTGGVAPGAATPWDELVVDANIIDCIMQADELHTMTSQSGFEALLYGKTVHCYGRPFYSGWGLTTDHAAGSSRGRVLDLATLVYGTLIHYPRYIDPVNLRQVSVEHVVNTLEASRTGEPERLQKSGYVARQCQKAIELLKALR